MKKLVPALAAVALIASPALAKDRMTHNPKATNTETILHVWSWNFPAIAQNMKQIADAGFTMLQTSPVQACYNPEGQSKKLFDKEEGNWYYYYQPTDWKIGNQIVGTKEQMKEMLDSAAKYNVKVLVDVLPNHTAFDIDAVSPEFYKAVAAATRCSTPTVSLRFRITTTACSAHFRAQAPCPTSTPRIPTSRNITWSLSMNF